MTQDRQREAPADRFAVDVLEFDLHAEVSSLRAEQAASGRPHAQKSLFKHGGRTIALFVLNPGAALPEHSANGTVTVQPVEGELEMTVAGKPHHLRPGSLLVMAPGTRHDVRAPAAAAFLLQVSLAAPAARS